MSLFPVAVTAIWARGMAVSMVFTSNPSIAACSAQIGSISVTQGVADTGATFEEVEAELIDLVRTGYVDIDNAPHTGVIIYRFTELA